MRVRKMYVYQNVDAQEMVTCLYMFHPPKGMLRVQKNPSNSRNLAKVRIKTLMSYREIAVSAGASGLQL